MAAKTSEFAEWSQKILPDTEIVKSEIKNIPGIETAIYYLKPFKLAIPENKKNPLTINLLICNKNSCVYSIRRFQNVGGRLHVTIYVYSLKTKELFRFIYYTSQSDGFFWRFCMRRENGSYAKGYDYTSSSFINMNLQKWLFEQQHQFNIAEGGKISNCPLAPNRLSVIERERLCGHKLIDKTIPWIVISRYFPTLESVDDFNKKMGNFLMHFDLNNKEESRLMLTFKTNDAMVYVKGSRTEFLQRVYKSIKTYITIKFGGRDDKIVLIRNRNIRLGTGGQPPVNIKMNVCRMTIYERKQQDNLFYVYYMEYNIKEYMPEKTYKQILHIVPVNNMILPNGLDRNYVAAGILIYKFFDYVSQINKTAVGADGIRYAFVGDIYNMDDWLL